MQAIEISAAAGGNLSFLQKRITNGATKRKMPHAEVTINGREPPNTVALQGVRDRASQQLHGGKDDATALRTKGVEASAKSPLSPERRGC